MRYFKILVGGKSCNGGNSTWFLPKRGPGKWMPKIDGELKLCEKGYHIVKAGDILDWVKGGCEIYEAEPKGKVEYGDNKGVCHSARLMKRLKWDDKIACSFACDCAERVLPIFEKAYPNDKRPRQAIEVARGYLAGTVTADELAAAGAARDAAGAAARDAAGAAAGDAWAAARDAAGAAAGDAGAAAGDAGAAAGAAARNAAGAAAGDAWAAARDAAGAAAGAVARNAAGAAAGSAEKKWQTKRLLDYLYGRMKID